MAFVITVEWIE